MKNINFEKRVLGPGSDSVAKLRGRRINHYLDFILILLFLLSHLSQILKIRKILHILRFIRQFGLQLILCLAYDSVLMIHTKDDSFFDDNRMIIFYL